MTPREIIAEAWAITRREASMRRWGCTSAFFELLLSIKLISYQIYFLYEYFWGTGGAGFFDIEIVIYESMPHWFFWTFLIVLGVLFIIEFFFPHMALGAIIGLAAKSHMGEPVKGGMVLALYNFFAVFTIHEIFVLGSLSTSITLTSVIMRYIEGNAKGFIIGLLWLVWALSNVLRFFFSFAEEAVVIDKVGMFEALGRSFKLIISYLGHIMFLLLLLFVISLRIILNVAIIVVIPGLVIGIVLLLGTFLSTLLTWIIGGIVGIALTLVASYFFAYLHVFKQTVWTITYLELRKHKDLDVIG
ncbi:MAG: hypothetical protein HOO67_04270 [Candidatus Peribacteraceae bacterium]|nr:hypothetical protein [Candidatus Peribacteraceae bacterium]